MTLPRIFCLIDESCHVSALRAVAEAGVTGFQVRSKALGGRDLTELTRTVLAAVRPAGAMVVVNDRLDVALAADADGVHLGATDLDVSDARRIAPELLIGATCRSREEVLAAEGADYAGFGPVFATDSKAGLPEPLGTEAVRAAAGILPLVAIGGVRADNAARLRAAGAHGVAVIGAIWRARDPVAAAKELVAAVA